MKKLSACVTLSLVICLAMAFPVSAAVTADRPDLAPLFCVAIPRALSELPATTHKYVSLSCVYNPSGTTQLYALYCSNANVLYNNNTQYFRIYYINPDGTVATTSAVEKFNYFRWYDRSGIPNFQWYVGTATGPSYVPQTYLIKDYSTATFSNADTVLPSVAWHIKLGPLPPNITVLKALLTTARATQSTGYTTASWQILQTAISAADNLLSTTGYTQAQVDTAKNNIQTALNGLTLLPNTTTLRGLLITAKAKNEADYTLVSWQSLQDAISSTEIMLDGLNYNILQVELAEVYLQVTLDGLALLPDTTVLRSFLTTAKAKPDIGYTPASWQALKTSITAADNLLATPDYTQMQVDDAIVNIQYYIDNLIALPPPPPHTLRSSDLEFIIQALRDYVVIIAPIALVILAITLCANLIPVNINKFKKG